MTRGIKKSSVFIALLCIVLIQVAFVSGKEANDNTPVSNAAENVTPQYYSPDIELKTSYISDTLEAGKTYVYKLQVKNIDQEAITIEPKLTAGYPILYDTVEVDIASDDASVDVAQESKKTEETESTLTSTSADEASDATSKIATYNGQAFDNSAISISAPETINAGETVDMIITVKVPEKATGSFYANIDMNVNDVENSPYNPQVILSSPYNNPSQSLT
jgi:hypothetical protein